MRRTGTETGNPKEQVDVPALLYHNSVGVRKREITSSTLNGCRSARPAGKRKNRGSVRLLQGARGVG